MIDSDVQMTYCRCSSRIIEDHDARILVYIVEILYPSKAYQEVESSNSYANNIERLNCFLFEAIKTPNAMVLFAPKGFEVSDQDIKSLAHALQEDPLFGFAMPRVSCDQEFESTKSLLTNFSSSERRIVDGAPVLIRSSVLRDFGLLNKQALTLDAALVQLFLRANRRGISARLVNNVLIRKHDDVSRVADQNLALSADYSKGIEAQDASPEILFERLLRHQYLSDGRQRHLLVDIRNLATGFNGTAHHLLALLGPLSRLSALRKFKLYFWVLQEPADFHKLTELYGDSVIHSLPVGQIFDASIRLSQPWSMTELRDQASVSAINVFSILDTIGWDCHYIRMPHLDGVWRTMAEYSDGFVFISDFSSRRFLTRFPNAKSALSVTAHCSMDPSEYWSSEARRSTSLESINEKPYVLIVGNKYYHKGLSEIVPMLSTSFPLLHFKVLGEVGGNFHNVEQIASGAQSELDMAKLYSNCICLVFPSFYEGFGLPILEALAFGKPVLARHSELVEEVQKKLEPVSEIKSFASNNQLLTSLKFILNSCDKSSSTLNPLLPTYPYCWNNSAEDILNLVETLINKKDFSRCRQRLEFFYRLQMFDVERDGWVNTKQNQVILDIEHLE
jgi:glycosyltransferase involved in cell wall biosynthesis